MDNEGIDALVMEKLLALARELHVVVHVIDDTDLWSLQVARSVQAHLLLCRKMGLTVCAAAGEVRSAPEDSAPAQVFASAPDRGWRRDDRPRLDGDRTRKRASPRRERGLMSCFNCGLQGHVASGCPAPRRVECVTCLASRIVCLLVIILSRSLCLLFQMPHN
ncbi:unnamed protein product [Lampetra planeri]